jgi:hypothetical protein
MGGSMVADAGWNAILRASLVALAMLPHNGARMRRLLWIVGLAVVQAACSGNIDDQRSSTSTGAGDDAGAAMPLACGDTPPVGQIISVCIPMDGDFCLPAQNSPGLLAELAKAKGVCAETSSTACCGKAAYRQVVCDQPPGVSDCCYDVHFIDPVVCP